MSVKAFELRSTTVKLVAFKAGLPSLPEHSPVRRFPRRLSTRKRDRLRTSRTTSDRPGKQQQQQ